MFLFPQAWKLSKMLMFLSKSWYFGPAGLEIVQHVNVFVQKLMFVFQLVEKLDFLGPAGLEIVQHVNIFVQKLMFWSRRLGYCPKSYCFCSKLDVFGSAGWKTWCFWSRRLRNCPKCKIFLSKSWCFGPAGLEIMQNVYIVVQKLIFLATRSCNMTS